jgi:hypothetical protein
MTNNRSEEDVVEHVIHLGEVCAGILAHMARWQGPATGPDSLEQAFRKLLAEVLEGLPKRHPEAALDAAMKLLADAVKTIEGEILLVEPPQKSRPFTRGRRPSRRPR